MTMHGMWPRPNASAINSLLNCHVWGLQHEDKALVFSSRKWFCTSWRRAAFERPMACHVTHLGAQFCSFKSSLLVLLDVGRADMHLRLSDSSSENPSPAPSEIPSSSASPSGQASASVTASSSGSGIPDRHPVFSKVYAHTSTQYPKDGCRVHPPFWVLGGKMGMPLFSLHLRQRFTEDISVTVASRTCQRCHGPSLTSW